MTLNSLRKIIFTGVTLVATAGLLGSCGGGGTADVQQTGGFLRISPQAATVFAGVPFTVVVTGAQLPYSLSSSEPSLLPVPSTMTSNTVELLPANPGVVDTGLQPEDLPVRTVTVSVRAANGQLVDATYKVAQNFLFGYNISITSTCPAAGAGTNAPQACAGGDSLVTFTALTNGTLAGGRQFKLEVLKGPFSWLFPDKTIAGNTITVQSDHAGRVQAQFRVNSGVETQLAVIRIYDVPTGAYIDTVFTIQSNKAGATLTIVPDKLTFNGVKSTDCGVGQADVFVFDGKPPFTASSSDANIFVNETSSSQPGRFTVRAVNPGTCVTGGTVVFLDALGARGTLTVDTTKGTQTTPAMSVAPSALTLVCGTSGSATVVGGQGNYFTSSSHPRVTAAVSNNTVTVTRIVGDGATVYPISATVNVSDGASISSITVAVPANCP